MPPKTAPRSTKRLRDRSGGNVPDLARFFAEPGMMVGNLVVVVGAASGPLRV